MSHHAADQTRRALPRVTSIVRLTAGLAAILLAGATVRATTLVVIRTPHQVIIAADSLVVWHGTDRGAPLTCKLDTHGDVIFAIAGLMLESDFDARRFVRLVLDTPGSLEQRALVLERVLRGPLLGMLGRIRRELPRQFAEQLESGFVLNVTIAAVRNRVAELEMRDFYAETTPTGELRLRVVRLSCPRDCPQPTEVFGVGETAAMMQHLSSLPRFPAELPGLAKQLVEIEIDDVPALVGPPIDVVRAGDAGIEWLQRKPACGPSSRQADEQRLPALQALTALPFFF